MPRCHKMNWLNTHHKLCNNILNCHYSTLLIGDSLIAGLSRYSEIWRKYFEPLNTLNCGISGDRVQNVLWRCTNFPPSPSVKNVILLCGTNNIQCDSPDDIVDGIIEITAVLKRIYRSAKIVVCGLLPRDHSCSVNRIYVKETNDVLFYKCNLNNILFVNPTGWTLENHSLKPNLFYMDNLHLVKDGNTKLAEMFVNAINPTRNALQSQSMSTILFDKKRFSTITQTFLYK